ncbi:MAG: hypothetical protein RMI91_10735 [Gemmatales bacterium]|nr:hypothetical protein [Gemmatales bacterium]
MSLTTRREFLVRASSIALGLLAYPCFKSARLWGQETATPGKFAYDYLNQAWGAWHLNNFLELTTDEDRLNLKKALELLPPGAQINQLSGRCQDVYDILKGLLWSSSHWLPYWWRSVWKIDYHGLVQWCANKLKAASPHEINNLSTFALERKIMERLFIEMWDKSLKTTEQREKLLCQLDKTGCIKDKAAVAALSGAAALATLSATVFFSGFAFYTTMSTVICTVAGFLGVTLPFAVYTTASSTVALLAGPIGWAAAAVLALAGLAVLGRADVNKTTAFVVALHCIKVQHLQREGYKAKDVFGE